MKFNKKIASVGSFVLYYMQSAYSLFNFIKRDKEAITQKFIERIMLAVTEVNGCKVCSQAHAEMALKSGMTDDEISEMLSGNSEKVPKEQSIAIAFATYYADCESKPDKDSLNKLIDTYGRKNALSIIAVIRMITIGNVLGIAGNTFHLRIKGEETGGSLLRELGIFFFTIILIPVYFIVVFLGLAFNH